MNDTTAASFLSGLRTANFVIVLLIGLGLELPSLLLSTGSYRSAGLQVTCFLVLLAVVLTDGVLLTRQRSWGRARWPVAVVVLAVAAVASSGVAPSAVVTPAHWSLNYAGWIGVLLFGVLSLELLVVFIATHYAIALLLVVAAAGADQQLLTHFLLAVISNIGLQLTLGAAMWALREVAAVASEAAQRRHETGTGEALAEALQADRSARYQSLRATAAPLLRGLAGGWLRPFEPEVQRRCAVEAARMRRLFAEADDAEDPLLHELGAVIDVAERTGIVVSQAGLGRWPRPPREVRAALVDEISAALLDARSAARVTVDGDEEGVALSVVADGGRGPVGSRRHADIEISTVRQGEQTWVQARWSAVPSLRS